MAPLALSADCESSLTGISNVFIDEYMQDTNDVLQLKVYIYLLRMKESGIAFTMSDIADKFEHSVKDVTRALMFWEKKGLVSLRFNGSQICAISIRSITRKAQQREIQIISEPASGNVFHHEEINPNEELRDDKISRFTRDEAAAQLVFIAETYLGKTLSANDMQDIIYFYDVLGFDADLITYLLEYCVEHGKKNFKAIRKTACDWAELGINDVDAAKNRLQSNSQSAQKILRAIGSDKQPTDGELELINKWFNDYKFRLDIILQACKRACLKTENGRLIYADGILEKWHKGDLRSQRDINTAEEEFRREKKTVTFSKATAGKPRGNFSIFTQRSYDEAIGLEEQLWSNI